MLLAANLPLHSILQITSNTRMHACERTSQDWPIHRYTTCRHGANSTSLFAFVILQSSLEPRDAPEPARIMLSVHGKTRDVE